MIIALPPKTLTAAQKAALTKKGYVVIEIDDPEKVRVINVESPVQTNDYFMAALHALDVYGTGNATSLFIKELRKRLLEQENQPKAEEQLSKQ